MNPAPQQRWNTALYEDRYAFVWQHGASLIEMLAPRPGERILDLGCGAGHLTAQIAAAGAEVVGIDHSADMIEQARRNFPRLRFDHADARIYTPGQPFDAIFSNAVLHWIREPASVIASIRQALKPGGRFVAEFGGKGNVRAIAAAMEHALAATGDVPFMSPWYFPGIAEYAVLLEQAGLEVTFASLFDRPTPLEGEDGLRNWIEMFANAILLQVAEDRREEFLGRVERELRPVLYRDGRWSADYRRLRISAWRTG
jgi:trans-aconitate 2-methyltransferase